jgi:hypothetical protein
MTLPAILALVPGFAGLGLSLVLLFRNELRRARISLQLLAAPDSWLVSIARRGSGSQASEPAEADQLSMYGIFPVAVTNDGPRGGAIWGISADVDGLRDCWRLRFNPSVAQPYALAGRSCESWNHVAFMLDCDFSRLGEGLRDLQQPGHAVFRISYHRQNWRGQARRKTAALQVSRADLRAGFKNGAGYLDVAGCQVVPQARLLVVERFSDFHLPKHELDNLTKWALRRDPIEYVAVPDGSPDRLKLAIRQQGSTAVDQGWCVTADGTQATLDRIREVQQQVVRDITEQRAAAIQI